VKEGWEAVIGLEVHAQLKTDSKIFRRAAPEFIRARHLSGKNRLSFVALFIALMG
jgi:Asp-tRNA(Asn)/Glu-tRNA(Gln) amidotransferase B subunit